MIEVAISGLLAAEGSGAFLGENLIVYLLMALGGALFVGNLLAVIRPPQRPRDEGDLATAPPGRSIAMALLGLLVFVVALVSLLLK